MAEFDPSKFFLMGQQSRMIEEQTKAQTAERLRHAMLPQARQQYFEGSSEALQQQAPDEWVQLETQRVQREKAQQDASFASADRARQEMLLKSKGMFASFSEAARDPTKWASAAERVEALGFAEPGSISREPPPMDQVLAMVDKNRSVIEALSDPKITPLIINVMANHGYGAGMEAAALRDPKVQFDIDAEMDASRNAKGKPTTTVNVGASDLTKSNETTIQKQVFDARVKLDQLGQIEKSITEMGGAEKLGSFYEGLKSSAADKALRSDIFAGFVTNEAKQQLGARAVTIANIANLVNKTINELAGANVPEGEMMRMRRSLPSEDDNAVTITAKLDAMRQNFAMIERHGVQALGHGISLAIPEDKDRSPAKGAQATQEKSAQGTIIVNDAGQKAFLLNGNSIPKGWRAR
ncbi:MAG: hypothetical protein A2Y75_01660 [Candidatus Solincola sediminis]|uniref:Uncharacterized protein n=1 Tax=Candidatus Solincola sediminis TaxID=1797199 RepID=A0A1F2WNM6_9ACTN|nr:MAG: hypothetical protein A2Y75_01660 [Candidatus Solincola sediminis]